MRDYFIVDNVTGLVLNRISWDGIEECSQFVGQTLYLADDGGQMGQYRLADGTYADTTLAVQKRKVKDAINARMNQQFLFGYSPKTGPLSGHTLQCRDSDDRTNWLTSQTSYMAAVQMGYGNAMGASFRTAANITVTLTFQQGLEVLTSGMASWGKNIMARSWELKDWVEAANTFEELAAIDINANWPTS